MKIISASIVTVLGTFMFGQTILATSYPTDLDGISPVTVLIENEGGVIIPPVEPGEPPIDPVDPINPNPGALSILYISGLNFGKIIVDDKEQNVPALPDFEKDGSELENLVALRDVRSSINRDGWTLTVKQSQELLEGSTITMSPYVSTETAEKSEVTVGGKLVINNEAQMFARTSSNSNPSSDLSIQMAKPGETVSLNIPDDANYAVGEYTTSLIWELVSGPMPSV